LAVDSKELRSLCYEHEIFLNVEKNQRNEKVNEIDDDTYIFDYELYKERYTIERSNAWIGWI